VLGLASRAPADALASLLELGFQPIGPPAAVAARAAAMRRCDPSTELAADRVALRLPDGGAAAAMQALAALQTALAAAAPQCELRGVASALAAAAEPDACVPPYDAGLARRLARPPLAAAALPAPSELQRRRGEALLCVDADAGLSTLRCGGGGLGSEPPAARALAAAWGLVRVPALGLWDAPCALGEAELALFQAAARRHGLQCWIMHTPSAVSTSRAAAGLPSALAQAPPRPGSSAPSRPTKAAAATRPPPHSAALPRGVTPLGTTAASQRHGFRTTPALVAPQQQQRLRNADRVASHGFLP